MCKRRSTAFRETWKHLSVVGVMAGLPASNHMNEYINQIPIPAKEKLGEPRSEKVVISDVKLYREAVQCSYDIRVLDRRYEEDLHILRKLTVKMPFGNENYEGFKEGRHIFIKGFEGTLTIGKLYHYITQRMYALKKPIVIENFKIYGAINKKDTSYVEYYRAVPQIGVHFHGKNNIDDSFKPICFGDVYLPENTSLDTLKKNCTFIAKALEVINTGSPGGFREMYLPPEYKELSEAILAMVDGLLDGKERGELIKKFIKPIL